jgi:hypothetical protein
MSNICTVYNLGLMQEKCDIYNNVTLFCIYVYHAIINGARCLHNYAAFYPAFVLFEQSNCIDW